MADKLAGEVVPKTICGFCKRSNGFEVVSFDVDIEREINIVRCRFCKAAVGAVELFVPEEVSEMVRKDRKERE